MSDHTNITLSDSEPVTILIWVQDDASIQELAEQMQPDYKAITVGSFEELQEKWEELYPDNGDASELGTLKAGIIGPGMNRGLVERKLEMDLGESSRVPWFWRTSSKDMAGDDIVRELREAGIGPGLEYQWRLRGQVSTF